MSETPKLIKIKKKRKKAMKPIAKLGCLMIIGFSAYLLFGVYREIQTTMNLRAQVAQVQAELTTVQEENQYLTAQRDKLQDPDYVQSYARGNYMLTKDGEQIFYLPSSPDGDN